MSGGIQIMPEVGPLENGDIGGGCQCVTGHMNVLAEVADFCEFRNLKAQPLGQNSEGVCA